MKATAPPNEKLLTLNFVLIWVSSFFAFTSFNLLLPILPLYVVNVGGTNAEVGLITGILVVTSVTARPWIGHESDRRGKKLVLVWGTLALVASSFSYMLASTVVILIFFRLFHGV
ncbi:MAG: MFS transporter, partial [Dehalococcoidia bacterium]|nr:MFS transporter [Dehalococcoidia bacterium]